MYIYIYIYIYIYLPDDLNNVTLEVVNSVVIISLSLSIYIDSFCKESFCKDSLKLL